MKNDKNMIVNNVNGNFPHFSETIQARFATFRDKPLFTTSADGLFDVFLDNLPQEARQEYTCNCCKHFVNRFGGLVSISETGEISSVLWDDEETPEFFAQAVKAMKRIVLNARVNGVFLSKEKTLGYPTSGGWEHMNVAIPASAPSINRSRVYSAEQEMAKKREEFGMLTRGLLEYPLNVVDQAVTLLESEALHRGDRYLGVAKFLQELHNKRNNAKNSRIRDNVTWLAVATAPSGFAHVKSSMIGTLLDDIASGMSFEDVSQRFKEKMNPSRYNRAQVAPSAGNIKQAEKIVAEYGIAESLSRRYARYEEIPQFLWQGKDISAKADAKTGGVFGNIKPKEKQNNVANDVLNMPQKLMTWEKFQREVLPTAKSIEVMLDNPNRFMALVTASKADAPNILQWSNSFSWYYHGGIDGDIAERVKNAGGQYLNNDIRASLAWDNCTDLDLHCITPNGVEISYRNKRVGNGWLDVDANAGGCHTMKPVENIRWSRGLAPNGRYQFFVNNFQERGEGKTSFRLELEIDGKIYTTSGSLRNNEKVTVFTFEYIKGQEPRFIGSVNQNYVSDDAWNVPLNRFVKVKGITESPNLWGENNVRHAGHHIFFLLEGCKDLSEGKGRGFFTESLKPEFREIRKTLEAYTASTPIEGADTASACGVGYSKDSEWNVVVRVTSGNVTRLIKIDRWD